jgi:hypothetical protein
MLELGGALIGTFQQLSCTLEPLLEPYKVPDSSLSGKSGSCEEAQRDLPRSLASDARVIRAFDALVEGVVLPRDLTARFAAAGAQLTASTAFYTSTISTLRLCGCSHAQAHGTCGGTTRRRVRPSARRTRNFWMPLTDPRCTLVNIQFPNSSVAGRATWAAPINMNNSRPLSLGSTIQFPNRCRVGPSSY